MADDDDGLQRRNNWGGGAESAHAALGKAPRECHMSVCPPFLSYYDNNNNNGVSLNCHLLYYLLVELVDRLNLSSFICDLSSLTLYMTIYLYLSWPSLIGKRPSASQIDCLPFNRCKSTITGDLSLHCALLCAYEGVASDTLQYYRLPASFFLCCVR